MPMVPTAPTTPALAAAAPDGTGLTSSLHGYTLVPAPATAIADAASTYSFHIDGPDGKALTQYQPYESELLLCYIIRSDLTQYTYVQPAMREDGDQAAASAAAADSAAAWRNSAGHAGGSFRCGRTGPRRAASGAGTARPGAAHSQAR